MPGPFVDPRSLRDALRGYRAIGYARDFGTPPRRDLDDALETVDISGAPDEDWQEA
jgi:hypothetical protein